jgi:hypothetical protein
MPMSGMTSSGSGIASSYYESRAQASVLKREEQQAAIETQMAQEASGKKFASLSAEERTLYGKAGVDITSGSPLLIMSDTAAEGELEQERIGWAGYEKRKMLRWYQHVIKHGGDAAMSANATALSAQIVESVAGGIAGGAAGGVIGGIQGSLNPSAGFSSYLSSLKPSGSPGTSTGLGTYSRRG